MKKFIIIFAFLFVNLPVLAIEHCAVFELKPITEIQNGKMNASTGNYKQIYKLKDGQIYRTYSENINHSDYTNADDDHFLTTFIPTLAKHDYYYGIFSYGVSNSIVTIDKNFNNLTLYQFNGLDNHCTVWYGKAINKF